jgi:SPP1 gp7 family putative phage head morphogenesis protein
MANGEERTANELLLDALIRHQVYLMRLSESVRKRIAAILDATEDDIDAVINRRLKTGATLDRLQVLTRLIRNIRLKAWDQVDETWLEEAIDIAKNEPALVAGIMSTVAPVVLDIVLPPAPLLKAIVTSKPFQGKTLKEWAQQLRRDDLSRIEGQIKIGMIQGETGPQIARRVTGTVSMRGRDGTTEVTRRQAQAITRTAINHITNWAKRELYELNADIIDEELFVATLDNRTTAVCRGNDGKRFEVGKGPIPPLHWNCRSVRVAIFNGAALGERPFKSATETRLIREFSEQRDLKGVKTRDDLPRGLKGPFDRFARARVRQLTGRVPASTSYNSWLKTQTAEFQDDVLGPTRGKLFRDGGLQLDQYINRQGDELTLSQLARQHASAFRAAGLDPEDFL